MASSTSEDILSEGSFLETPSPHRTFGAYSSSLLVSWVLGSHRCVSLTLTPHTITA